jgi:hypothetical protein
MGGLQGVFLVHSAERAGRTGDGLNLAGPDGLQVVLEIRRTGAPDVEAPHNAAGRGRAGNCQLRCLLPRANCAYAPLETRALIVLCRT